MTKRAVGNAKRDPVAEQGAHENRIMGARPSYIAHVSVADAAVDWIGGLKVLNGEHAGEDFTVLPWQRDFICRALSPDNTRSVFGLSVARGAGKTSLCAALAACFVLSPLAKPHSEVVIVAASFSQGRILWRQMMAFLEGHPDWRSRDWQKTDNNQQMGLRNKHNGVAARAISSDPKRAHGLQAALILADEPSQWPTGQGPAMWAALTTSLGKLPGSRMIALGTRPASADHYFERLLKTRNAMVFAASDNDDPFDPKSWHKACPSLAHFPSLLATIAGEAADAKEDEQAKAQFLALRCNMGVSDTAEAYVLDPATWEQQAETDNPPDKRGPYVLGIDLGGSVAMSACAAYWPRTGRLEAFGAFSAVPSIDKRAKHDGAGNAYEAMRMKGELIIAGNRTVSVEQVITQARSRFGSKPAAIAADRYRKAEMMDALDRSRIPATTVEWRGMGFRDGGEDIRAFRRAVLDGDVKTAPSLLLRSCIAFARVASDPAGNEKLTLGTKEQGQGQG